MSDTTQETDEASVKEAAQAPAQTPDRSLVTGTLLEVGVDPAGDEGESRIVIGLRETSYKLHLICGADPATLGDLNDLVTGRIVARARRVDKMRAGGRFIEPVMGRPRRLQGRVIANDADKNTITVQCGCPFTCELTMNQRATQFDVGQLVGFDVERGARFEPID